MNNNRTGVFSKHRSYDQEILKCDFVERTQHRSHHDEDVKIEKNQTSVLLTAGYSAPQEINVRRNRRKKRR